MRLVLKALIFLEEDEALREGQRLLPRAEPVDKPPGAAVPPECVLHARRHDIGICH